MPLTDHGKDQVRGLVDRTPKERATEPEWQPLSTCPDDPERLVWLLWSDGTVWEPQGALGSMWRNWRTDLPAGHPVMWMPCIPPAPPAGQMEG